MLGNSVGKDGLGGKHVKDAPEATRQDELAWGAMGPLLPTTETGKQTDLWEVKGET